MQGNAKHKKDGEERIVVTKYEEIKKTQSCKCMLCSHGLRYSAGDYGDWELNMGRIFVEDGTKCADEMVCYRMMCIDKETAYTKMVRRPTGVGVSCRSANC